MAHISLVIKTEPLDHDHGHWCNRCRLSTGARVWLMQEIGGQLRLLEVLRCIECGGQDVTVSPDGWRCS